MAKRYYWLKLKEDFFEEDTIEWLEEQENGKEYCLFYLKMCLKSIKTEGILIRKVGNILVPYDEKHLAKITNTDFDTVVVAMELFKKIGLIQILEGGEIFIPGMDEMIGSETDKAKFMRNKRAKEKELQQGNEGSNKIEQPSNNVTQNGNKVTIEGNNVTDVLPNCYTEQEKDKEQEKELDIDKEKEIKQLRNYDADAVFILNSYYPNLKISEKEKILQALKESGQDFYYLEEKIYVLKQRDNINSIPSFLCAAIKGNYKLKGAC